MTEELRPPLVPPEVDLRGLDYMPFFGNHLFGSEFNARCSDAEWRAGMTLWWAAWNQQPAGSLPDDDLALCRLADLGRDVRLWKKLKANALRGFVRCSDGRLYHEFLCKQVMVAWEKRVKEREKKRKWREGKDRDKHQSEPGQEPGQHSEGTGTHEGTRGGTERLTGRDVTGRDGTNLGSKERLSRITPTPAVELAKTLRALGVLRGSPSHPEIIRWAGIGVTEAQVVEAVRICKEERGKQNPPIEYIAAVIGDLVNPPDKGPGPSQTALGVVALEAMKSGGGS